MRLVDDVPLNNPNYLQHKCLITLLPKNLYCSCQILFELNYAMKASYDEFY